MIIYTVYFIVFFIISCLLANPVLTSVLIVLLNTQWLILQLLVTLYLLSCQWCFFWWLLLPVGIRNLNVSNWKVLFFFHYRSLWVILFGFDMIGWKSQVVWKTMKVPGLNHWKVGCDGGLGSRHRVVSRHSLAVCRRGPVFIVTVEQGWYQIY